MPLPYFSCDLSSLQQWEFVIARAYLEGRVHVNELIYFMQADSANIPVVECLLQLTGALVGT